jgi:Tol biopolymer transport system component
LISSNYTGRATGNGQSAELAVTPDGRYLAFSSAASDLGGVDTNGNFDVYLVDRVTGVRRCISSPSNFPPSVPAFGAQSPVISDDGRFVGFRANHSWLVPEITNYPPSRPWNFFVYDTVSNRYFLGSPNGNARTVFPEGIGSATLSSDGRYSIFFVGGVDADHYRSDLETGTSARMNADLNGNRVFISNVRPHTPDHRYFVFATGASNVVADPAKTDQTSQIYCRDMTLGITRLVSVATNGGYAATNCFARAISPDGRYVAFRSRARNLQAGMGGGSLEDVFIRDMVANETWCVTVNASGTGSMGNAMGIQDYQFSADGSRFLFPLAPTLPNRGILYVHDVNSRTNRLLATNTFAEIVRFSKSGRFALYGDSAMTLMSVDVETLQTQRIGALRGWSTPNSAIEISNDGRWTFFVSHTNEVAGVSDANGLSDVFAAPTVSPHIASVARSGPRTVQGTAFPSDTVQLQRSSDLLAWDTVASGQASNIGTVTLEDSEALIPNAVYRLRSP